MKLKKGNYYWVTIEDIEVAQYDGNGYWNCIGRDYRLKDSMVKPIEYVKSPGVIV